MSSTKRCLPLFLFFFLFCFVSPLRSSSLGDAFCVLVCLFCFRGVVSDHSLLGISTCSLFLVLFVSCFIPFCFLSLFSSVSRYMLGMLYVSICCFSDGSRMASRLASRGGTFRSSCRRCRPSVERGRYRSFHFFFFSFVLLCVPIRYVAYANLALFFVFCFLFFVLFCFVLFCFCPFSPFLSLLFCRCFSS